MGQPNYQDIHNLRTNLQRMINAFTDKGPRNGALYDGEAVAFQALRALEETEHLDRVEHVSILKSSTLDKLEHIAKSYHLRLDEALELLINEHNVNEDFDSLTEKYQSWLADRKAYKPMCADELRSELRAIKMGEKSELMPGLGPDDAYDEDIQWLDSFCLAWDETGRSQSEMVEKYRD